MIRRISSDDYADHGSDLKHVFLVGDLKKPTPHPFVRDTRVELIACFYDTGDDGRFHWHPEVTEYELVLDGKVGYLDVASGDTLWYRPGDLSVIPAGLCVKRVVPRSSRTLAVKVPSHDEKVHCDACDRECSFREETGS